MIFICPMSSAVVSVNKFLSLRNNTLWYTRFFCLLILAICHRPIICWPQHQLTKPRDSACPVEWTSYYFFTGTCFFLFSVLYCWGIPELLGKARSWWVRARQAPAMPYSGLCVGARSEGIPDWYTVCAPRSLWNSWRQGQNNTLYWPEDGTRSALARLWVQSQALTVGSSEEALG